MPLGQLLIDSNLIDPAQLDEARKHRKLAGGTLVDSLLALELVDGTEIECFLGQAPLPPESVEETGLSPRFLLFFVLKSMYVTGIETGPQLSDFVKLSELVLDEVLEDAKDKRLVEVLGLVKARRTTYRYAMTDAGRRWASEALDQCAYAGPAPVPFAAWQRQVLKQSIGRDRATSESIAECLSHLVLPEATLRRLGPAANSSRAILLYGAVGNGKTSIAEGLGQAFDQEIHIPHCVEVDGQIIKLFDAAVHEPALQDRILDARWVRCRRPVIVTGGELSIEMLDLSHDPVSNTYEAPAHIKATGGVFILDDFGRQRVRPAALLNRWMIPLERRIDYLTLHTGKKLKVFFDELVILSTNTPPGELIDEAGLRRIPYKLAIDAPLPADYEMIFRRICAAHQIELSEAVLRYMLDVFYPQTGLTVSAAHPRFLVDQALERARFEGTPPVIDLERIFDAAHSLLVEGAPPSPPESPSA